MRKNNRGRILDAALRVIEREGIAGVTYQSVAAEADMTNGGLVYHFPTRESLMLAIHAHAAAQWEQRMKDLLGKDVADATADERLAAYVQVTVGGSSRPELLLILEPVTDPAANAPWQRAMGPWTPRPTSAPDDALDRLTARLAADGLWLYEAIGNEPLDPELRRRFLARLGDLAGAPFAASPRDAAPDA